MEIFTWFKVTVGSVERIAHWVKHFICRICVLSPWFLIPYKIDWRYTVAHTYQGDIFFFLLGEKYWPRRQLFLPDFVKQSNHRVALLAADKINPLSEKKEVTFIERICSKGETILHFDIMHSFFRSGFQIVHFKFAVSLLRLKQVNSENYCVVNWLRFD